MDKGIIKQIAAEIAAQLPFGERTGLVLVLYVISTAVAAGLAAWFGSFLKTNGQNFATTIGRGDLMGPAGGFVVPESIASIRLRSERPRSHLSWPRPTLASGSMKTWKATARPSSPTPASLASKALSRSVRTHLIARGARLIGSR